MRLGKYKYYYANRFNNKILYDVDILQFDKILILRVISFQKILIENKVWLIKNSLISDSRQT